MIQIKIKSTLMKLNWAVTFLLLSAMLPAFADSYSDYTTYQRYNISGQLTGVISSDPDGSGALKYAASRHTYNAKGQLVKTETGELSNWQSVSIKPSNWSGFTLFSYQTLVYDSWGRKTSEKTHEANGAIHSVKQYSFDSLSRLQCETIRMNSGSFNSLPASACTLGAEGSQGSDRITKYAYDSRNQILNIKKAVGTYIEQTYVTYTYQGRLRKTVRDANGNLAQMNYDGFGRMTHWYFPSKTNIGTINSSDYELYKYDENNNRNYVRKRDGQVITYTHDKLNWVTKKDLPGTANDVYYDYDLRGLQLYSRYASSAGQGITNIYDSLGQLTSTTNNMDGTSRALNYLYDTNGNRTRVTHPDGNYFTYEYDGLNRLNNILENGSTSLLTQTYNNNGARSQLSRTSGANTSYGYDEIGRIQSLTQNLSGNINDLTNSFDYNPDNDLTSLAVNNTSYLYVGDNNIVGTYDVNGLNQYTSAGGKAFTYDAKGNLTSDGDSTFTYDIENRLLIASGTKNATLKYDPLGRLYETIGGGVTTRFLYDGDALIAEYDNSGNLLRRYVHGAGIDEPLVTYSGSSVVSSSRSYLHSNYQGSIIAQSDGSAALLSKNTYDAYGIPSESNSGRFAYTGQIIIPELDLYYYKARMYSPRLGRLLQTDPIGYEDQVNLYAYANNNPYRYTDPDGQNAKAIEYSYKGGYLFGRLTIAPLINHAISAATAGTILTLGGLIYQAVNNESSSDDSGDSKDPVDGMKEGSTPGKKTKGRTTNWDKPGGIDQANEDFDNLVPDGGKEITDGKGGKGRTGVDSNGRNVNVRPNSKDGRPTVEIQDGKKRDKFRYDDDEW